MGNGKDVAKYIEHTLLKTDATPNQVVKLCTEAKEHGFRSVCVCSSYVSLCKAHLAGSKVRICSVIGFPLGAMSTQAKVAETGRAIKDGADEVDMVLHVGYLKADDDDYVWHDIAAVVEAAHAHGVLVKVIFETALLTDEQKRRACALCLKAGADYVKTCTGFGGGGATVEDIRLMKEEVGDRAGIKAAGGVRDYEKMVAMINAGATCIGTSSGIAIMQEAAGARA